MEDSDKREDNIKTENKTENRKKGGGRKGENGMDKVL